jgi:RNA polymerase sigma-70 factor (ECF subfamily)
VVDRHHSTVQADGRILAGLRSSDPAALEDLYALHGPLVYRVALRVVGDAEAAQDVVQEVFVYVWRNAQRYDDARGTIESWLVTLARSRGIDRLRAEGSRKRRTEEFAQTLDVATGIADEPLQRLAAADTGRRVRAALAALPLEQRRALEIAYWEGLSHSEIATRLNTPLGTIKTRIRQGMLRLRELLDSRDTDGEHSTRPPR